MLLCFFCGLVFNVRGVLYAYLLVLFVCRGFLYFVVVGYAVVVCLVLIVAGGGLCLLGWL